MEYDLSDMPPLADPDAGLGGFIPPPLGATQGGYPSPDESFDPLTGAPRVNSTEWMPMAPAWATPVQAPSWANQQQPPPLSAPPWTSGYGQYPPALTPQSTWSAPTPAGSWGPPTPAGSWGPPTPASANSNGANWVQQSQQGYYTPFGQESSAGQPISASPWFGVGGDALVAGGSGNAGPSRKKTKRHSRRSATPDPKYQQRYPQYTMMQPQQNPYPNYTPHEMHMGMGNALQRSLSHGGGGRLAYSIGPTGYPQIEEYNARNLARRPRDWRPEYDPRAGLASYMPRVMKPRSDVIEWSDPVKRVVCDLLAYKPYPPIFLDLRFHPLGTSSALEFPYLHRPPNDLDFAQLATSPPASELRLYHPRLPWYIDVVQKHTNGVTVYDVLVQMFQQLDLPIAGKHWWNEEIDDVLRSKMTYVFNERTAGNKEEVGRGVKRVDFLRGRFIFEGLVKGRNGMWEMKTRKLERERQVFSSW